MAHVGGPPGMPLVRRKGLKPDLAVASQMGPNKASQLVQQEHY